jgi:hypothetical protein
MKSVLITILLLCITIGLTKGQEIYKNALSSTPFVYINEGIYGGSMIGYGIDLNYSREIFKNMNLNSSFGKGAFSGKNSTRFELEDDEKGYLPLTRWNVGFHYSFVKTSSLNLSGGGELLLSSFPVVESLHKGSSGEVTFRQVSTVNFPNYLIHLKMENKLGANSFWTTQFSYQPYFIDTNEVLMLKTGIEFRF